MTFPSIASISTGLAFGIIISYLAYRAHALSISGAVAAALLGWVIFGLGGLNYTIVLLAFFLSSSGLSFAFKQRKSGFSEKHAKGSRRDAGQVAANGGIAGLLVFLHLFFPQVQWIWWAYCASLAAANADTWATELGILSPTQPRLVSNWRQVEMGTSGGITPIGTLAALLGALWVGLFGFIYQPFNWQMLMLVALAGLFGSLVDSWLGATYQSIYYCPTCGKETEKFPLHSCGTSTHRIRGLAWMDNDWVNGICTLSSALVIIMMGLIGWI
jgi:uncharacterized protein (TIGR00297 family)